MSTLIIIMVVLLFVLAISDLIVGVSNDAVNFLNSAIGSKAAPFWAILLIASLGVLFGATFSSGMMEVARKGIFHPQHFFFTEIMFIFLAVMITDVILLDLFNTFGMPTSTTVSIVFELLGAAVAISVIKIYTDPEALELQEYINSAKALAIISGILLSVVVAFIVGAVIQFFTRLAFSFDFKKSMKYFGAIWGGLAITAITYFIIIKGAKGASFMTVENKLLIKENTLQIIAISFAFWTIILQLLHWIAKVNILKVIVLAGTFALAMAFAGNDLVNFIGVPLAGFESFKAYIASGSSDPDMFSMVGLAGKVKTPTLYLIIAGLIMVITLWLSSKSRSVVRTSLNLSSQDAVDERFGSSFMARSLVRASIKMSTSLEKVIPTAITRFIGNRFDQSNFQEIQDSEEAVSFDLLRASVNLVVASILIAFATSLKLPLSTTYVTFMVAMGTSLADKAWGRESAVYRVTGVIAVIGGWFLTAFTAFTAAFIVATLLSFGGWVALSALVIIVVLVLYRTHVYHNKKSKDEKVEDLNTEVNSSSIIIKSSNTIVKNLTEFSGVFQQILEGLVNEDRKILGKADEKVTELNITAKNLKDKVFKTLNKFETGLIETGPFYVQVHDYLREMAHCLTFISKPAFKHVNNGHQKLLDYQINNLTIIQSELSQLFANIIQTIESHDFSDVNEIVEHQQELLSTLNGLRKEQIKMIKAEEAGTRNSLLYFSLIYEIRSFLLHSINLLKSHRDFIVNNDNQSI